MSASLEFAPASLRPTMPPQIADQIGAAIVEEQFLPGARLKEVELAALFKVSRATVREAMRILESRGLVRILPQRGAQVTMLSRVELENLFEIRAALLGLSGRHAARFYDASDMPLLESCLAALAKAENDARRYAMASASMVECVARLSRNEQLLEMISGFAQRIGRYTRLGLATRERRARSLASWRRLVAAITAKDQEVAEQINRRLALENRDAALVEIEKRVPNSRRVAARHND